MASVNESREILEPTLQAILASDYDSKRLILVMAYEGRAGKEAEDRVLQLTDLYKDKFKHAMAVKHPANIPGEVIGKGGNITYAARQLQKYLAKEKIDPKNVLVTTLDSDNRVDKRYFASLSYLYCVVPKPLQASYQPLAMYTQQHLGRAHIDAGHCPPVILFFTSLVRSANTLSRNFSASMPSQCNR